MAHDQGAGKGKRVTARDPAAAVQSGDALVVVGGGAVDTADARSTDGATPAVEDSLTRAGVRFVNGCL